MFFWVALLFFYFDYKRGWYSTNLFLVIIFVAVSIKLLIGKNKDM